MPITLILLPAVLIANPAARSDAAHPALRESENACACWPVYAAIAGYMLLCAGFYWWSTLAIRRRYGSLKPARFEAIRMNSHPAIQAVNLGFIAMCLWFQFGAHTRVSADLFMAFGGLMFLLRPILDDTNPRSRRIAYAVGLAAVFAIGPLVLRVAKGALAIELFGMVWLALSVFDYLLLKRTFAEAASRALEGFSGVTSLG